MKTTFERLKAAMENDSFYCIQPDQITLEATLEGLNFDSLDIVSAVMAAEDEFDVEIPDEEAFGWVTFGDVVATIDRLHGDVLADSAGAGSRDGRHSHRIRRALHLVGQRRQGRQDRRLDLHPSMSPLQFPGADLPHNPTAKQRRERDAAFKKWADEEAARIAGQRRRFLNLPRTESREALQTAMLDRAWFFLDAGECEAADALLEFVPEGEATKLLDEFFDE